MNTAPANHHPLGPSQHPIWAECPRYDGKAAPEELDIQMLGIESGEIDDPADAEEGAEKEDLTPAGRGTLQHHALARAITGEIQPFEGLSEREVDEVVWAVKDIVDRAVSRGYAQSDLRVETRLEYTDNAGNVIYFGTGDVHYGPYLDDAKFGLERNHFAQLSGYALAKMDQSGGEITTVHATAVYARFKRTKSYVITRETADAVTLGILAKRRNPATQPVPCQYCGWCIHKSYCRALTGIVDMIQEKRPDWAFAMQTMRMSEMPNDPILMAAARRLALTYVQPWVEGVLYATKSLAVAGIPIVGYRASEQSNSKVDAIKALTALSNMGVPNEAVNKEIKLSKAGIARAIGVLYPTNKKAANERAAEALLEEADAVIPGKTFTVLRATKECEDEIRAALANRVTHIEQKTLDGVKPVEISPTSAAD